MVKKELSYLFVFFTVKTACKLAFNLSSKLKRASSFVPFLSQQYGSSRIMGIHYGITRFAHCSGLFGSRVECCQRHCQKYFMWVDNH